MIILKLSANIGCKFKHAGKEVGNDIMDGKEQDRVMVVGWV